MRALRIAAWVLLAVLVVLAAGVGVFVATFDTQAAVARLAAQVHRATGRTLAVSGPVRLRPSWPPEVVAEGVSLSNVPGGSRPAMVTVDQVRGRVALAPLLSGRVELDVVLVRPDLLVENGNWRFTPEPPPAATGPAGPARTPWLRTQLRRVVVEDGRLTLRDGPWPQSLAVPDAAVTLGEDGGGTVQAHARRLDGAGQDGALALAGSFGPSGFPLRGQLDGGLDAGVLHLASLAVDAPAADQPGHLKLAATVRGLPVAVDLALPPASLANNGTAGANGQVPFTLAAASAGATMTAQGGVAGLASRPGLDTTVSVRIPDLPALSPLAGTPLPSLGGVSLDGRVLTPAGLAGGVAAVRSLRVLAGPGNLGGDVALGWAGRLSLRGTLTSSRLDVDALADAFGAVTPHPALANPLPSATVPAQPAVAPPTIRAIPDRPFPLAVLRAVDLDLTANLTNLTVSGQPVTGIDTHVAATEGRVRLDPLAVVLPAGRLSAAATADAAASPPTWSLDARGAGLRLDRATEAVHGTADLDLSFTANGATTAALLSTLDGHGSLVLVNGDIDNRLLAPLLDAALRAAHVNLDLSGRSALRCLLLPVTATHGTVATPGLFLDTSRVRLEGEGTVDLADEALAFQLRPTLLLGGGATVEAPLRLSGSLLHPAANLGDGSGRSGVRIGLGPRRSDPDACGPDTAPTPAPAVKPADILRGLLR